MMARRFPWLALAALAAFACHDDTVTGPDGQTAYPGFSGTHAEWTVCGRRSVEPRPDYSNPELIVSVEQRRSHFSIRVPDLGTIIGDFEPYEPGRPTRYAWKLYFDPPCSGVASGAGSSATTELQFVFSASEDWQCTPCTDRSGGSVRLYIPIGW